MEFDDDLNAEEARNELNGKKLAGYTINVEWSKRSGKYDDRETNRRSGGVRR